MLDNEKKNRERKKKSLFFKDIYFLVDIFISSTMGKEKIFFYLEDI